jgi:uncharacterized protein YjbI with pentapeptide repeats
MDHQTRKIIAKTLLNAASVLSATTETRLKATLAKLDPLLQDLLVWIVFNAIGLERKVRKNGSMFEVSISPDGALDYDSVQSYSPTEVVDLLKEDLAKSSEVDAYIPWLGTKLTALMKSGGLSKKVQDDLIRGFRAIAIWAKETRTDIGKVSIEEALAKAEDHVPRAAKKGTEESDANPVVYRFPDGFKIVQLKTDEALKHEGGRMKHCVGDYCDSVKAGTSVIYSLRSPDGDPEKDITMEYKPKNKSFNQMFGPRNRDPSASQKKYLIEFVENKFPHDIKGLLLAGKPLKDIDLTAAIRMGANLSGVNLRGVNLTGADLTGADLRGADLAGANLTNADLTNANANRVNLNRVNLEGANLEGTDLTYADLGGSYLNKANLEGSYLSKAYLEGANLEDANIRGANLEGAFLKDAYLNRVNLEGANLKGANLKGADLKGADLKGANLEGAGLYEANLEGANLEDANLEDAYLEGIKYNVKTIWPIDFTPPPSA